jgi:hypothetical protein
MRSRRQTERQEYSGNGVAIFSHRHMEARSGETNRQVPLELRQDVMLLGSRSASRMVHLNETETDAMVTVVWQQLISFPKSPPPQARLVKSTRHVPVLALIWVSRTRWSGDPIASSTLTSGSP